GWQRDVVATAFGAAGEGRGWHPVHRRSLTPRSCRATQPGVSAAARREAPRTAGLVLAARRARPRREVRLRPGAGGAARRAHAEAAVGARLRGGRARPRVAHACATGRGPRLSAAALRHRRTERAAPLHVAG